MTEQVVYYAARYTEDGVIPANMIRRTFGRVYSVSAYVTKGESRKRTLVSKHGSYRDAMSTSERLNRRGRY